MTLKVWDLETGAELRTLRGHSEMINGVALSADGRLAISASDEWTLKVWDLESGREVRTLEGHSDAVNRVSLSPDAKLAISASWDKTLTVWDLGTGVSLATFTCDAPALCCAFIPNRKLIGCDHLGRIHFLLLESGG